MYLYIHGHMCSIHVQMNKYKNAYFITHACILCIICIILKSDIFTTAMPAACSRSSAKTLQG